MAVGKKITAIIMCAVIVICASGYIYQVWLRVDKLVGNMWAKVPEQGENTELLAKMTEDEGNLQSIRTEEAEDDSLLKQTNRFKELVEAVAQKVACRNLFIDLNGGIQRIMDKNMVFDADPSKIVYKLRNGYLSFVGSSGSKSIAGNVESITDLAHYAESQGTDFLYINAPYKNNKYDNQLPLGVFDYINSNADEAMKLLDQNNVAYVDLREVMHEEDIDWYDMFFRTDSHWKPEACLWSAGIIFNRYLAEYRQNDFDMYDPGNYNIIQYPKLFLGIYGKRTGRLYAGKDDISIITPRFETSLSLAVPAENIERAGDFSEVIIDYNKLVGNDYSTAQYDAYTGGGHILKIIKNEYGNGKKCLLVNDSFGRPFAPLLALTFSEVHAFDIRDIKDYTVVEYAEEINPDIIIVLYTAEMWGNPAMYEFGQ